MREMKGTRVDGEARNIKKEEEEEEEKQEEEEEE